MTDCCEATFNGVKLNASPVLSRRSSAVTVGEGEEQALENSAMLAVEEKPLLVDENNNCIDNASNWMTLHKPLASSADSGKDPVCQVAVCRPCCQ